jgi:mono/diheme cytochrome c family protein
MLSRALSLATVTLLIGCFAGGAAYAQVTNLEAGKSPSQIFAGTCTACHKSPRGLLKTVPASSLPGFFRQH